MLVGGSRFCDRREQNFDFLIKISIFLHSKFKKIRFRLPQDPPLKPKPPEGPAPVEEKFHQENAKIMFFSSKFQFFFTRNSKNFAQGSSGSSRIHRRLNSTAERIHNSRLKKNLTNKIFGHPKPEHALRNQIKNESKFALIFSQNLNFDFEGSMKKLSFNKT